MGCVGDDGFDMVKMVRIAATTPPRPPSPDDHQMTRTVHDGDGEGVRIVIADADRIQLLHRQKIIVLVILGGITVVGCHKDTTGKLRTISF